MTKLALGMNLQQNSGLPLLHPIQLSASHCLSVCAPPHLSLSAVFWSCFATRRYYKFHGTSEPTRQVVERQVNYFSYFHRWSDAEMALYIFGCAGGAAAWLLSLATAALERRRAAAAATTETAVEKLHSSLHESCCSMLLSPYRSQMLARALLHE